MKKSPSLGAPSEEATRLIPGTEPLETSQESSGKSSRDSGGNIDFTEVSFANQGYGGGDAQSYEESSDSPHDFPAFDLGDVVPQSDALSSQEPETHATSSPQGYSDDFEADATSAASVPGLMAMTDLSAMIADDRRTEVAMTRDANESDAFGESPLNHEVDGHTSYEDHLLGQPEAPVEELQGVTAAGVMGLAPESVAPDLAEHDPQPMKDAPQSMEDAPQFMGFLNLEPSGAEGANASNFAPEESFVGVPQSYLSTPAALVQPPGRFGASRFGSLAYRFRTAGAVVGASALALAVTVLSAPLVVSQENLKGFAQAQGMEGLFETLGLIPPSDGLGDVSFQAKAPEGLLGGSGDAPNANGNPTESSSGDGKGAHRRLYAEAPNRDYFTQIVSALQQGDPEKSAELMKQPPPQPLESAYDLDAAAMAAARFYLFVGKAAEALKVIEVRCANRTPETLSVEHCMAWVHAQLSLGRVKLAHQSLLKVKEAVDAADHRERLQQLEQAVDAAQQATPRSIAQHLLGFLSQSSSDVEWERQQSFWILESLSRLGHQRWSDFAQIVFNLDREKFVKVVSAASAEGSRYRNSVALTRFLDFLAARYGHTALGFQHGLRDSGLNDYRLALTLQALSANMSAENEDFTVALQKLRDKAPFGEVERLLKVNLALQENRWSKAYQILNAQIPAMQRSRFGFEWKLAGALFAIGSNNVPMAKSLYQALQLYGQKTPSVTRSFDYWYTVARLGQFIGVDVRGPIAQSQRLTTSERERGLVAALELNMESQRIGGMPKDLESFVTRYPWHESVLSAAILATGRAGRDPTRYMRMQDSISGSRLAAGREKNLLLDSTVEELIKIL